MKDLGESEPLAYPLFTSSVYTLADLDTVDRISEGESAGYIYARDAHPNAHRLSAQLSEFHHTVGGLICASGMSAISAVILALAQQGDRLIASNLLYGRTTQLFLQELSRFGIRTDFVDPCDLSNVEQTLHQEPAPRALFVETLSNPLLRVVDISSLAKLAHARNCRLIVDNTFATPVLCQPCTLGADFVIESLTKMISGHSDVTLGWIGLSPELPDANDWLAQLTQTSSIWGFNGSPFDSWLTERGVSTLSLRMRSACDNALSLANWLAEQPAVKRVAYPGRENHPEHDLAQKTFNGTYGNLLSFELHGGREAVNTLMRAVPEIPFSPSLGNVTTTWSHPMTTSHRYVSPAERERQGITEGLIRVSVGIEESEQLIERLSILRTTSK